MLGRIVNESLRVRDPKSPWGDVLPIIQQADFRMCNLECAISDRGKPWSFPPKEFHFRSDAKNVQVLHIGGINAVSLANNHVLDFGYEALADTLKILDTSTIYHAGAGLTIEEARRPAIVPCRGSKIGMVAFTDNEPDWEAREKRPGTFYVPIDLEDTRARKLLDLVKQTKATVDTMIVSAHWGPNWGYEPPKEHVAFAHALIDAGADIVFGHSGHVFRGVETYNGRPILYCAGNFIDDYAVDPVERNDESFVFLLEKRARAFSCLKLYPTKIEDCTARMARGAEKLSIAQKMQFLSAELKSSTRWKEEEETPTYLEVTI